LSPKTEIHDENKMYFTVQFCLVFCIKINFEYLWKCYSIALEICIYARAKSICCDVLSASSPNTERHATIKR